MTWLHLNGYKKKQKIVNNAVNQLLIQPPAHLMTPPPVCDDGSVKKKCEGRPLDSGGKLAL